MNTRPVVTRLWSQPWGLLLIAFLLFTVGLPSRSAADPWMNQSGEIVLNLSPLDEYPPDLDELQESWQSSPSLTGAHAIGMPSSDYACGEFYVDLPGGKLGTKAQTSSSQEGGAYAYATAFLGNTISVLLPAGQYPDGAFIQLGFRVRGEISGTAWGDQDCTYTLRTSPDNEVTGGVTAPEVGVYDVRDYLSLCLLEENAILDVDQWVEIEVLARLSSRSVAAEGSVSEGVTDFLGTGAIESLILPSTIWSSASSGWSFVSVEPANIVPVPLPSAAMLGAVGLAYSGRRLSRRTR